MLRPQLNIIASRRPTSLLASFANLSLNARRAFTNSSDADDIEDTPAIANTLGKQKAQTISLRTYKPRTPGIRHLRRPINDHLYKGRAYLPLTYPKKGHGKGGRNVHGCITVRHRGGGAKRRIRVIDFVRNRPGPHLVERIEYDPGRSAHIALLTEKATKRKSYIVAAEGLRAGDVVQSYRSGIPQDLLDSMGGVLDPGILAARTAFRGNCLPMHMIPVGTQIFCVGSAAKRGAVFARSAGTSAVIVNKNEEMRDDGTKIMTSKYVDIRLQSGEVRRVSKDAGATIGVASNIHHQFRQLGKAGRSRWLNIRPTVRGVAMNRVDHPHGGGRGKSKSNRHPVTPWGKPVSYPFHNSIASAANTTPTDQEWLQDAQNAQHQQVRRHAETAQPRQASQQELVSSVRGEETEKKKRVPLAWHLYVEWSKRVYITTAPLLCSIANSSVTFFIFHLGCISYNPGCIGVFPLLYDVGL